MRWEGCKDGCFWTMSLQVLVRRQFARVCHSVNMEWDANENHVAVIALHNCGKFNCQIFELLKPLKISRLFICQAIKHHEELWRVEDRAQLGRLKSLRAQATIKTLWDWIRQNPLWKRKIMSRELNNQPNQCCASSETINPWECTSPQMDTSLLLLWRRSDGQEQSVSTSGMLRTGTKTSSSRTRKSSPSRSSTNTRTTRFMLKHPVRWRKMFWGHYPSHIMVWWEVSHQGVTHLHFYKKEVKLVSECVRRTCYKELWNILRWPTSVVKNGSSSRTQFLPKRPRQLRSGCGGTFWPLSASRFGFRGV